LKSNSLDKDLMGGFIEASPAFLPASLLFPAQNMLSPSQN